MLLKAQINAFITATGFLTIIPVGDSAPGEEAIQYSLFWYPAVGLVIGCTLAILATFSPLNTEMTAAILLTCWVLLTGALHLDGLADFADAWVGGLGSRDKTLRIMKDPQAGPMAIVAVVLVLLLKYVALLQVVDDQLLYILIIVPVVARLSAAGLFATSTYIGTGFFGLSVKGKGMRALSIELAAILLLLVILPQPWGIPGMVLAAVIFHTGFRYLLHQRLQGFTGDCAGALVELTEVLLLYAAAATR